MSCFGPNTDVRSPGNNDYDDDEVKSEAFNDQVKKQN